MLPLARSEMYLDDGQRKARQLRDEAGGTAWLVAKIERAEAVADDETLDGLIKASDGSWLPVATWALKSAMPNW